jgi:hypothetical protein
MKYSTNVKNHLGLNVIKFMKKFVYSSAREGDSKWEKAGMLFSICGWSTARRASNPNPPRAEHDPIIMRFTHEVQFHRSLLGLNDGQVVG